MTEAPCDLRTRSQGQFAHSCQRKTIAVVVNAKLRGGSTVSRHDMRFGEPYARAQHTGERSHAAITCIRRFR